MPQFDINFYYSQIFWLIVVFSCLYILVYKFIIPMAKNTIENRKNSIEFNIANANKLAATAKDLQQRYENEIQQIQDLVDNIHKEELLKMNEAFVFKKIQLANELKAQIIQNNKDLQKNSKLFWINENQSCINLASLLVEKLTGQPANLELLNQLYKKML